MQFPPIKAELVKLKGGLDEVTPTLTLPPGSARQSSNFECSSYGGYSRIDGYERYDGRPAPSKATYTAIYLVATLSTPSVGQTLTGGTSGATGVIASVTLAGYLVITKVVGVFVNGEVVSVGATTIGTTRAATGTTTSKESAQNQLAAANIYRTDILPPTGSGAVRGVFV